MSGSGNEAAGPRILVVDDEPALRRLLVEYLSRRGLAVSEAGDGHEMRARLDAGRTDLVVLDVTLPGEDGFALLSWLRSRGDDVPIVMLTSRDGLADRLAGLGRGADDYLTKPFEPRELLARIRAVLRRAPARARHGAQPAPSRPVRLGRCLLDPASGRLTEVASGREVALTAMELELLRTLLRHKGMALSRARLCELAGGAAPGPGARGIDAHVFRLRRKLETEPGRPQILRTERGTGFVLVTGEG